MAGRRIEIRLPHAARQFIVHASQFDPRIDERQESRTAGMMRIVECVGTDVALLPVGRYALLTMPIEGFGVTGAFIAEQSTKRLKSLTFDKQSIPVVVTDFMTEMPEQRAIGFAHLHPYLFAVRVIGFLDIEGDQAVGISGGGWLAFEAHADEVKDKAFNCSLQRLFLSLPADF